jgi:hypothetical protein
MSEPLPPSTGDQAYQPISGFALAGLVLSAGFAALVLLSAIVAIVKGSPIFYPPWLLMTPIAAFVLCVVGRNQILNSDGTRAGLRLATWGMALSLISGLGYAAYFITVGYAVAKQANDFLAGDPEPDRGFLTHLARSDKNPVDLEIAFLLTRPASGRIKIRPGDNDTFRNTYDQPAMDAGAGEFSRFRDRVMTRMLARAGEQAVIEPLGVQGWEHDRGSYKVSRRYRIKTPEAELDLLLLAESTEAEAEGQHRQWFVNLNMAASPILEKRLTPLGTLIDELREQSSRFLETEWRQSVQKGQGIANFAESDKSDWKRLYPDTPENMKGGKNVHREYFQNQAKAIFTGQSKQPYTLHHDLSSWPFWGVDDKGRFWIDHPIRITLDGGDGFLATWGEVVVRVRSKEPFDPAKATPPAPFLEWSVDEMTIVRVRVARGMSL